MLKNHRSSRLRMIGGAAAVTLLAGASALLGTPGFAHPHPEADGERQVHRERTTRTERVVIMNHKAERHDGDHADGDDGEPTVHRMRIRHGGDRHATVIRDCDGGQATNIEEGAENERTRVILCSRGDATPAQRAERLQRARDRLAGDSELSAEARARVTAALDREIARLRGQ